MQIIAEHDWSGKISVTRRSDPVELKGLSRVD